MSDTKKQNSGSPAQPVCGGNTVYATGLTKLEYAAIQIMAHLIERAPGGSTNCSEYAVAAIETARALFAELEKSND